MTSESEQQSILEQLEHLIFDEHKLISYKWVTNHFQLQIETAKQLLSQFVDKHQTKLWIHHCVTGYKPSANSSHSDPIFTIFIVSDKDLQATKDSFDTITSAHVHSVAVKQSETMKDFYGAQYQTDYQQQRELMTSYLAKSSAHDVTSWSNITNNQVRRVSSPHLNRALSRTKQEKKQMNSKNTNNKKQSFNQTIDTLKNKKKAQATPLKAKFNKLQIENNDKKKNDENENKSNTNAKNNNNAKGGGIAACFAKAATLNNQRKKPQNEAQETKPVKKKKSDDITNFFGTKKKAENKKKAKPKKKKKKKKANKESIQPAQKRKRGAMETENNLVPINYDSESSESEQMDEEYGVSDDEELVQMTSRAKKRKIMDDSEDEDEVEEDDDIDLEKESKPKKLSKKQIEKQQKKEAQEKLLVQRKNTFFGKAAGNKLRTKKKYKTIQKTHINEKGMFVTEDVQVTDEDCEEKDTVEVVHKHQHMVNDGDGDVDMVDDAKKKNTNENKKAAAVKKKVQKEKKAPKKNGSITSFFKVK